MKNNSLSHHTLNADLTSLLLRLILGGSMVYHGYTKLAGYNQILPVFPDLVGVGSTLSFNLAIFAEFFCGLFLIFGLLTRLSVIPVFIAMAVAFFIAHGADPYKVKELAFVFLLLSVVVFVSGSGRYSVDKLIFKPKS